MESTYVITAANRGLGLEFARQLSQRGDRVITTARQPDLATELRALDVTVHPLDVRDDDSVREFGVALEDTSVDVLINNAGIGVSSKSFEELDFDELMTFFDVNSVGAVRVTRALLPHLRRGNRKVVANISSMMGSIGDNRSGEAYEYRASKAALNMLTRSLAIDLREDGFTCVVLHPGWVATDMGGSNAPLRAPESVRGMIEVLDRLTINDSGAFLDYNGQRVPW
jgi:NAD(P)-dependent dehydrogenase (short-subunit alcohol dehydrogenase family)